MDARGGVRLGAVCGHGCGVLVASPPARICRATAGGLRTVAHQAGMDAADPALAAQDGQLLCPDLLFWSPSDREETTAGRRSVAGGPGGALLAGGGARMPLVGAGRLWPRLDAGCRTRSGSAVPSSRRIAGGPAQWWRARCAGVHPQWRYGSTSTCCVGVAAPGESLAGADRPATTTPVGVAILLGGVVGNLHSLYSRIKFFG